MTHTAVSDRDKAILTEAYAGLNPAAIGRQIQALTAELLTLTTSKATAETGPQSPQPVRYRPDGRRRDHSEPSTTR